MMRFILIGTWNPEHRDKIVNKRLENGRLAPQGITVLNEWLDATGGRTVWLIEAESARDCFKWSLHWSDMCRFEIFPVVEVQDDLGREIT